MEAENKIINISLSEVPVVPIFERDRGNKVSVLFVLVRTDYAEKDEDAIKRAGRIADWLTDDLARRKTAGKQVSEQSNSQ